MSFTCKFVHDLYNRIFPNVGSFEAKLLLGVGYATQVLERKIKSDEHIHIITSMARLFDFGASFHRQFITSIINILEAHYDHNGLLMIILQAKLDQEIVKFHEYIFTGNIGLDAKHVIVEQTMHGIYLEHDARDNISSMWEKIKLSRCNSETDSELYKKFRDDNPSYFFLELYINDRLDRK